MALRYRIVSQVLNPDQTLTVNYTLAWTDTNGTEVWTDARTRSYPPSVTTAQVVQDVQADAVNAAPLIRASVGLGGLNGHTYELQNGAWVQVS